MKTFISRIVILGSCFLVSGCLMSASPTASPPAPSLSSESVSRIPETTIPTFTSTVEPIHTQTPNPTATLAPTSFRIPRLSQYTSLPYGGFNFAYSPDGQLIAMTWRDAVLLLEIETTKPIWSFTFPEEDLPLIGTGEGYAVAFSLDGSLVAVGGEQGIIYLLDAATGHLLRKHNHEDAIATVAFSADGKRLLAGSCLDKSAITDWNLKNFSFTRYDVPGCGLRPSPSQPDLVVAPAREAQFLDLRTGQTRKVFADQVLSNVVAFSPDGKLLATDVDHSLRIWDIENEVEIDWGAWKNYLTFVSDIVWSSNNVLGISGRGLDDMTTVLFWDMTNEKLLGTIPGYSGAELVFSPDGSQIVTRSDKTTTIWLIP